MPRLLKRILVFFSFLYLISLLGLHFFQEKLIFANHRFAFTSDDEISAFGFEPVRTNNNHIFIRESTTAKGWLLVFHGKGSTAKDKVPLIQKLFKQPLNIVLVEYPGFDKAPGEPSEQAIIKQTIEVYDYVLRRKDLPVLIFGESLGTGPATYLASEKPTAALILQTPYTSISDVATGRYPIFPVRQLIRHPFFAENWAPKVVAPTIVIHGTNDRAIPYENGKKQFDNFTSKKQLVTIVGSGHMYHQLQTSELYWPPIIELIKRVIN